jgi:hypothetical protein
MTTNERTAINRLRREVAEKGFKLQFRPGRVCKEYNTGTSSIRVVRPLPSKAAFGRVFPRVSLVFEVGFRGPGYNQRPLTLTQAINVVNAWLMLRSGACNAHAWALQAEPVMPTPKHYKTFSATCALVDVDGSQSERSYPYASEVIKVNAYDWSEAVTHVEKVLATMDDLKEPAQREVGRPLFAVWVITKMVCL